MPGTALTGRNEFSPGGSPPYPPNRRSTNRPQAESLGSFFGGTPNLRHHGPDKATEIAASGILSSTMFP
jgi:hypothetical protein